ncbi:MAG: hypothetical protein GKR95_03800 [Gammaproteobacteria bacterium]|nr:hypothetical protein [Gammaproteobacteria bacterium]
MNNISRISNPLTSFMKGFLIGVGLTALVALIVGLTLDIRSFDRTSGGYEYPYDNWTGEIIDFSSMYQTSEGLYQKGYVIDLFFNCNHGLITWEVFGVFKGEFRTFSERAIVVHRPQDECESRGFNTNSWAISDLL